MSHIRQYAQIHYASAHENEEMQGKRRDKGGEMSESWAAGCILQSAWDTSECEFVCASVYVCLRVFGRKEAHSHPLNPMIQPSLHQAWAWEREKERQRKSSLSEKAREKRHGEEREPSKEDAMRENVSLSTPHSYVEIFLSAGVQAVLWGCRAAGPQDGKRWAGWKCFCSWRLQLIRTRLKNILGSVKVKLNQQCLLDNADYQCWG